MKLSFPVPGNNWKVNNGYSANLLQNLPAATGLRKVRQEGLCLRPTWATSPDVEGNVKHKVPRTLTQPRSGAAVLRGRQDRP